MPAVNFIQRRGLIFIGLTIKNRPHIFLLDTGAEITQLDPELLASLRPHRYGHSEGVGGLESSYSCLVTFNILGKTLKEVVNCTFLSRLSSGFGIKLSGLIGQDLLSQFSSYTIDNKKKQFIFTL